MRGPQVYQTMLELEEEVEEFGSHVYDYKQWFVHNDPRHDVTISLRTQGAYSLVNCICNIWPSID